jgi:2-oxoglutarate dehydrogenase complex dehydrogenase (E1) component-like enzyme
MNFEHEFHGANLAYILELRERFEEDPNSVDESTRRFFEQWQEGDAGATSVAISNLQTVIAPIWHRRFVPRDIWQPT